MRYYIVAGEHSSDMHGADLITQIKKIDRYADFFSCGGLAMEQAMGKPCLLYTTASASIGLDFFKNFYKLWSWLKFCKKSLMVYRPHALILIDFSGFNMRLAAFAKQHDVPVYYYIAPKIWAYRRRNIANICRDVTYLFSILPFEVDYYRVNGCKAIAYVGNPLVQKVAKHILHPSFATINGLDQRPIVALLPGSRIDEVRRILPILVTQAASLPSCQFIVAAVSHIPALYYALCSALSIRVVYDQTYDLLALSKAAIVASGTATLEVALWNVPQVVVYKTSRLNHYLCKKMLAVPYISLVNLLLQQAAVPELIQHILTEHNLSITLSTLFTESVCTQQQAAYREIRHLLGSQETAVEVAQRIVDRERK